MGVTPVAVDCMACLVTGVLTPVGFRDASGIVHRVRWHASRGPFRLCDLAEDGRTRDGARMIRSINDLIPVEEP